MLNSTQSINPWYKIPRRIARLLLPKDMILFWVPFFIEEEYCLCIDQLEERILPQLELALLHRCPQIALVADNKVLFAYPFSVFHLQIRVNGTWDPHKANLMGPSPGSMGPSEKINGSQILNKIFLSVTLSINVHMNNLSFTLLKM